MAVNGVFFFVDEEWRELTVPEKSALMLAILLSGSEQQKNQKQQWRFSARLSSSRALFLAHLVYFCDHWKVVVPLQKRHLW